MNRKGLSEYWEIILCLVIFIIVVIISIYFVGVAEIKVEAKVNAENADFTCQNDLTAFLQYETDEGITFDELLIKSYANNEYTNFSTNVERLFDQFLGGGAAWRFEVYNSTEKLLSIGQIDARNIELCESYLPLPCKIGQDCKVKLQLEVRY